MSASTLRHLHMGCGEPLVALWPALWRKPHGGHRRSAPSGVCRPPLPRRKDKGAC